MFLALRELKHAKLRYILIGLIMVLIAWLVLFVTGLANGLANDNGQPFHPIKQLIMFYKKTRIIA